jgi:hypothetical protein
MVMKKSDGLDKGKIMWVCDKMERAQKGVQSGFETWNSAYVQVTLNTAYAASPTPPTMNLYEKKNVCIHLKLRLEVNSKKVRKEK